MRVLLEQCQKIDAEFKRFDLEKIAEMNLYAVEIRYPDYFYVLSRSEAEEVYRFVIEKLKDV